MRIAITAAALLVAAVGIVATGVFLCAALHAWLLTLLSPAPAALLAAGIVFVLSLVVIWLGSVLGRTLARRARLARQKRGGTANAFSAELGRLLGENAQDFVSKRPILSLIVALAGGFAIGASPRLRAFLENVLKG